MNFDKESKSRWIYFSGRGWVQGRVELSCEHVDINKMIIHDNIQIKDFVLVVGWGTGAVRRQLGRSTVLQAENLAQ